MDLAPDTSGRIAIPFSFAQWGQSSTAIDTHIQEGSYLRCYPAEMFTPSSFYLNLTETWFQLETFQATLQSYLTQYQDSYDFQARSHPRLDLLTPGLFILCEYFGPKDAQMEWHRAIVLENPYYTPTFQGDTLTQVLVTIQLLDFGTVHQSTLGKLKYMPKHLLDFPLQGIHCELVFNSKFQKVLGSGGVKWGQDAGNKLFDLCEGRILGVTFLKRQELPGSHGNDQITNGKWIVSLDVIEGQKCLTTTIDIRQNTEDDQEGLTEAEVERRRMARTVDPSLTRHPDGMYSNLVGSQNRHISVHFVEAFNPVDSNEGTDDEMVELGPYRS